MNPTNDAPFIKCPDCGSDKIDPPDSMGWQMCRNCGTDFAPDYAPDYDEEASK